MKFFVYVDWTTEETPRPFYVGKGTSLRVKRRHRNELHSRIVAKHGFDRRLSFETNDEAQAFQRERELIVEHRTFVHGGEGWWGANLTLGGEGVAGAHPVRTAEHNEKIGNALRGRPVGDSVKAAVAEANRHRVISDETRAKLREARRRVVERGVSDETREKLSRACRAMHERGAFTEETRSKISESKRHISDETRQRLREGQRRRHERERLAHL